MFLTYEGMINKLKNYSEKKVKYGVFGKYVTNVILFVFITIFILYLLTNFLHIKTALFVILYWLIIFVAIVIAISSKCALGMSDETFIIIKFRRIGYKVDDIIEIPFDKIKSIDYHKFINTNKVEIVYRDNRNRLRNIKVKYSSKVFSFLLKDQNKDVKFINKKLIEMQKVLDKGDF